MHIEIEFLSSCKTQNQGNSSLFFCSLPIIVKMFYVQCIQLLVVSDASSRHLSLWSVLKKKPVSQVKRAHGTVPSNYELNWVSALATLHNTDLVATGSCDGTLNLWSADHNKRKLTRVQQIDLSTVLGETNFQKELLLWRFV